MRRLPAAGEKDDSARTRRPAPLGLAVLAAGCLVLIAAYLGNAAWNLLHLHSGDIGDPGHLLAAATLPVPLVGQAVPQWVELASAAVFLLLALLAIMTMRAASSPRRRKPEPTPAVETYVVFRGTRPRTNGPVIQPSPTPSTPDTPDTPRMPPAPLTPPDAQ